MAKQEAGGPNQVSLQFLSRGENVAMARLLAAAMVAERDLTVADLDEIKVVVSEAVSNAIIHGYQNQPNQLVEMKLELTENKFIIRIHDDGVGIADIEQAMQPNYSTVSERMGLGFAFMTSFMDKVEVVSVPDQGTVVTLTKHL